MCIHVYQKALDIFGRGHTAAPGKEVMVFPVPHRFAEPQASTDPFRAGVYFKVNKPGYTIALDGIHYWTDPLKPAQPSKVRGPFACDSRQESRTYTPITHVPISLPPDACTAMWIEFDADTPDPAQTFYFDISGLSVDGNAVSLPVTRFQEAKRFQTVAVP
jgi:hypothetical protein